ncbi:hypothetical protein ACFWY9_20750 [Amycolatopsis sp. NPDC059027]|uniref:hypothetical protein n=1 Tax=unclassified Amycolatopsis TaxID=2618356 RepID=UPI003672FBEE
MAIAFILLVALCVALSVTGMAVAGWSWLSLAGAALFAVLIVASSIHRSRRRGRQR